jgi:putative RecB family exonuclease
MPLYSHSKLSTFEQCSLKFKFNYIDKVETEIEQTIEAFLGSMVHEVLEKIYKDQKFQKTNLLPELLDFYRSEWQKNWNKDIVIVRKEYSAENFQKMGEQFITDYYKRYFPFNQTKTIGLETENTVPLDPEKKYMIHVRIDRLALAPDNTYEIHDYKTANSLPTQEDIDNDRQLAIYAYGIKQLYPDAKKIRLIWHYLAFDKELKSERSDEQLESLRKEVLELIKEVENCKDFIPKQSALCDWCQFRPICPVFKHEYLLKDKTPKEFLADDGVSLANKYAALYDIVKHNEAMLEKLKISLEQYAEHEKVEIIYGSNVKIFIRNYPRLSFPKKGEILQEEFYNTIKKLGLWNELAMVDSYELAKKINNSELHPDFVKVLERFITRGKTTYIRVSNR